MRGLLGVEAARVAMDDLIVALSRYEAAVEAWRAAGGAAPPPAWRPTGDARGANQG